MNMGCWVVSRMRIAVRKPCGQVSGAARVVWCHGNARMRAPISPPPSRNSSPVPAKSVREFACIDRLAKER
jgi:hypothetical protein